MPHNQAPETTVNFTSAVVVLSLKETMALLSAMDTAWCEGQCELDDHEYNALQDKLDTVKRLQEDLAKLVQES